ncbi:hybrid sensor histidine kinase/response regulator, partial [Methylobacterium sp. CG09_land_8_20_14_0_10_71_15]|uniref:hybrid sensor histidine kinase/response regulator n=1 Tax=Methylobacterium sp. CG09_land_8_20_14_0_10_71_15 TaxID=1975532 RepID=UPI000CBB4279
MPDRRAERPPAGSPAGAAGALLPHPPLRAAWLLVGLCLVLPVALLVLAAFDNRREVLREANERVERTVRILHEHSTKVFETQRLILDRVNGRLTYADLASATEREALHRFLAEIQRNYDQVATITIVDETGALLVSSRLPPPVPEIGYADRDWFQVLRGEDPPEVYVSRSYAGRQSGRTVFNVARRIDRGDGRFHGAITVSVARDYFESFYREVDPDLAHAVLLLRADGQILAREPHTDLTSVPLDSPMLRMIGYGDKGTYTTRSSIDRVERIFSFRKLDDYPVYTGFGLSTRVVLETWRRNVLGYALVAGLTALALLAASLLALRRTRQEQVATARWRAAAAALEREAAEREAAEARFRQAQKMEALGHLTGGIAHDFNNLLTVVIGNLEMARRRAGDVEDRVRRGIEHAMDGARRAAVLTHRLLAFSRRSPLAPEPVALDRLVDGMAGLLRSTLGERIAVETVAAPDLWPVEVDVNQTENAILNLAVNARDAMPEGGRLTIETANLILDETAAAAHPEIEPGPYVTLAVTDTGTGMAPEVAARAFDPFFTTKAVGEGSGLGLAQVYGFMHQSSGTAILDSTPGVGT